MARESAVSSEPTWWICVSEAPATRPPSRVTICASVIGPAMAPTAGSLGRRLAAIQRLDHLVGEVDARAGVDGVLEDDVVLLLLGDLADDAVRRFHHLGELFVPALVQVFAELALLPLEVAVQLAELAFLG